MLLFSAFVVSFFPTLFLLEEKLAHQPSFIFSSTKIKKIVNRVEKNGKD
jgi:hypothetical protein